MPTVEIEEGWLVGGMRRAGGGVGGGGGRSRLALKQKVKQNAHAAALGGIVAGTVLLLFFSALAHLEDPSPSRGGAMEEGLAATSSVAAAAREYGSHHVGRGGASLEDVMWVPSRVSTSELKLADMKSTIVSGSMLAGEGGGGEGGGGRASVDDKEGGGHLDRLQDKNISVPVQASPQGALKPVRVRKDVAEKLKVRVEFYFESQSRSSKMFVEWVLVNVVSAQGMSDIMGIDMIPWGNTRLVGTLDNTKPLVVSKDENGTHFTGSEPQFLCPHGPSECEGNVYLACLNEMYKGEQEAFAVETCIITSTCADGESPASDSIVATGNPTGHRCKGIPSEVAPRCFQDLGGGKLDYEKVHQCATTPEGMLLLFKNMERTQNLDPRPTHWPWITIDGDPLNRTEQTLLGKSVCDHYVAKAAAALSIENPQEIPKPLGCFFFPNEPPIFPESGQPWLPITVMYIVGSLVFVVGVGVLAYWKWSASREGMEYEPVDER